MSSQGIGIGVSNVGTVSGVAGCLEYGNPSSHTTHFDLDLVDAFTLADNADICDGVLVYTFPAGLVVVHSCMLDCSVLAADTLLKAGATETGIGSVIGTGNVAVTAGFEDMLTGVVATSDGVRDIVDSDDVGFEILPAAAHLVHVNHAIAATVATAADLTADLAGDLVLNWSVCPSA